MRPSLFVFVRKMPSFAHSGNKHFMLEEDDDEFERDYMGFCKLTIEERITSAFENCGWVPDKVANTSSSIKLVAAVPNTIKNPVREMVTYKAKEVVKVLASIPTPVKTPTLGVSRDLISRLREWDSEFLTECQQNELWKGAVHHALDHLLSTSVVCPRGEHSLMRFRDYARTYRGVYDRVKNWTRLKRL